jgi:predicted TIM-barrel fold metal-dependent hydrolase
VIGLRLQLARMEPLPDLRSDACCELFRHARDLGWHVQLAIEGPRLRPVLDALLATGVGVVIDHFGHPDPADPLACDGLAAMIEAVDTGKVWIKLSGGFRLAGTAAWQDRDSDLDGIADTVSAELLRRVGTDRLLWGSDTPFVGYEDRVTYADVLADYRRRVPDAAQRAEIDRTALALYFG